MENIQFTETQRKAIDSFRNFLSSTEQVFMLKGAAGTGKTTLLSKLIQILEESKREFALLAPTGRAAYILSSKTGIEATTIHRSIYGLKSLKSTSQNKETEDDGGLFARFRLRKNDSPLTTVYIVDESSMISDIFTENEAFSFGSGKLLADLFEYARDRKIVFVGDYAQLPPINMSFSPALDKNYIEQTYDCSVTEVVLREVMRQQTSGNILRNATVVRTGIDTKTFIEFHLDDGEDTAASDDDLLIPYFALSDSKPDADSAVITYSNKQALQYNLAIRRHYFGEDAQRLQPGDLLLIARNNYAYQFELFNGNIVKVETCVPDRDVESRFVNVKIGNGRTENVELRFRKTSLSLRVNGKNEIINVRMLDNFLDDSNSSIGGLLARALVVDFEKRLPQYIKEHLPEIRKLLRNNEKLNTSQQELYDTYIKLLLNDEYYNAVICKYGYALTCHKAQGGEWTNVFVDMSRFGGTANENYFRWVYTAITRASKKLWHYRSPDFNYISNLVVEEIKLAPNLKVSIHTDDTDFCESRFKRLKWLCEPIGISATEDLSKPYQHIITFVDENNQQAKFQLWFKASGYNGKEVQMSSTSEEFAETCKGMLESSFAPADVPFANPERPFAEKLVDFVKSQFSELDIQLLDIKQEQFQDVFYVKTDGLARIGLNYTGKGNYSYMNLASTLGPKDSKLESFRQKFI